MTHISKLVVVLAVTLVVGACGSDDDPAVSASQEQETDDHASHEDGHEDGHGDGHGHDGDAASSDDTSCPEAGDGGDELDLAVSLDPDPPRVEETTFTFEVMHDGEPVTGAVVSVALDMTEMVHEGIHATAELTEPGRYELTTDFSMRGKWSGHACAANDEASAVVPLAFEVG